MVEAYAILKQPKHLEPFPKPIKFHLLKPRLVKSAVADHPLNVGGIGETGCLAANLLAKADLVIGIGTRYTDFTTSSKWIFQNENVEFLNINVSRFDAYKLDGIQITADAKAALQQLQPLLADYQAQWGSQVTNAKTTNDRRITTCRTSYLFRKLYS